MHDEWVDVCFMLFTHNDDKAFAPLQKLLVCNHDDVDENFNLHNECFLTMREIL